MGRSVATAAPILDVAWVAEKGHPDDVPLSAAGRQILLAISAFEGGYGDSHYANGAPSDDNWGAIHCPGPYGNQRTEPKQGELWTHCVLGVDQGKGGKYDVYFRGYPDAMTGAMDFIRVATKRGVSGPAFETGNAQAIAEQMYASRYFGPKKGESDADAIERYAHAIQLNAQQVAKGLGQPLLVHRSVSGPVADAPSSGGVDLVEVALLVIPLFFALRWGRL